MANITKIIECEITIAPIHKQKTITTTDAETGTETESTITLENIRASIPIRCIVQENASTDDIIKLVERSLDNTNLKGLYTLKKDTIQTAPDNDVAEI